MARLTASDKPVGWRCGFCHASVVYGGHHDCHGGRMDGTALDHMLSEILSDGKWTAYVEVVMPGEHGRYKATISRDGMTLPATGSTPTAALYAAALSVLSNGVVSLNRVCREATPD